MCTLYGPLCPKNIESFTTFHPILSLSLPSSQSTLQTSRLLKSSPGEMEKMDINPQVFLWPEEHKLVLFIIKGQGAAIAWDLSEQGNFRRDYFEPIVIPTVEHIPWVE